MGIVPMTVAVIAPLTCQAHRVIEVGEMRGIEAEMTIGHPGTTHAPRKCVGVQGRGQCPLIPLHIMSGAMMTTLMKTNTRQNFCVVIKGLIYDRVGHEREALPDIKNIRVSAPEKYSGEDDIEVFDTWLNGLLCWFRVYNVTGDHKDSMR